MRTWLFSILFGPFVAMALVACGPTATQAGRYSQNQNDRNPQNNNDHQDNLNQLAADTYTSGVFIGSDGFQLPYRLLVPPSYDPAKRYPLVVWLHGSGETGNDNAKQLSNGAELFATAEIRARYPAFVLVPQCPSADRWSNMSSHTSPTKQRLSEFPTRTAKASFELIAQLKAQYSIDIKHSTVAGLSMGGFGAWDWIVRRPDLFSSMLALSGGGDSHQATRLTNAHLWAFHGDKDTVVGVAHSRYMIDAIRRTGGHPSYSEISGGGHGPWAPIIKDPAVLAWLFE